MKKFIISLLAIISVATLSAQTKGEMYAGGSLGIGTYSLISGNNNIGPSGRHERLNCC